MCIEEFAQSENNITNLLKDETYVELRIIRHIGNIGSVDETVPDINTLPYFSRLKNNIFCLASLGEVEENFFSLVNIWYAPQLW